MLGILVEMRRIVEIEIDVSIWTGILVNTQISSRMILVREVDYADGGSKLTSQRMKAFAGIRT